MSSSGIRFSVVIFSSNINTCEINATVSAEMDGLSALAPSVVIPPSVYADAVSMTRDEFLASDMVFVKDLKREAVEALKAKARTINVDAIEAAFALMELAA